MSENKVNQTPENNLVNEVAKLRTIVAALSRNVSVVPALAADPATPKQNQMWVNTTSNTLKIYINGVVKTVTLT